MLLDPPDDDYIFDGRRRRGNRARAAILERAVARASTEGLAELTIGALAAELGVSKGNLTALFTDKQALQLATLDAAMARFAARIVNRRPRASSPVRRLGALCDRWFRHLRAREFRGGCFLYGTASEYRARPGPIRDRIKRYRTEWNGLLASTIREAQRARQIRSAVDPGRLVVELTSYQAAANVASLLGDHRFVRDAWRATRHCIREACSRIIDP